MSRKKKNPTTRALLSLAWNKATMTWEKRHEDEIVGYRCSHAITRPRVNFYSRIPNPATCAYLLFCSFSSPPGPKSPRTTKLTQVLGCDAQGEDRGAPRYHRGHNQGGGKSGNGTRGSSSSKSRSGAFAGFDTYGDESDDFLAQSAAVLKKTADQAVAKLKELLAKLKTAAEDTAHAASRPRHW